MLHLIIMSLPVIIMLTSLIATALDNRQNKPLKTIDVEICDDLYLKEVSFHCKCKGCKKRYTVYETVAIKMYITWIDSQCPYCNKLNSSKVDVDY